MSFVKRLRRITALIFVLSVITAQNRDEVIELINPVTGTVVDTNFVDVEITVADFFTIGSPGCTNCDGYVQITMDGTAAGQITSAAAVTVSGLSEGTHFVEVEALDPSGASFATVVYDSATFTVDMVSVPNLCPARNLEVVAGDARNFLNWYDPIALSSLNPFPAVPQSADYHTGTTNGSTFPQNSLIQAHGGPAASKEAGWAIFDIAGLNPNIEVDTIIFNYYVNAANWPFWSATAVDVNPLTASAADLHTEILSGTDAATAYLYQNEASTFGPGWYANVLLNGANDDLENDITQGYFVIGVVDRDGTPTYFLDIDGWNEANPPSIEIHWSAPGGRQGVYHAAAIADIPYSEDEITAYKNAVSAGLTPPTALAGIGDYETESYPNSSPREVIEGCGDFQNYSVYTSDGTVVATIDTNYYIHENLTNGTEYCYYVVANYTEGASSATATLCATPETFIPDGVTNLSGIGLHEEVALSWTDPGVLQLGVPYEEEFNESILLDLWDIEGDNWSWYEFAGNPMPCMRFYFSPTALDYDQSLYSPVIPLGALTDVTVSFDWEFSNFSTSGLEFLAIEYRTGTDPTWNVLEEFANTGDNFLFTNFSYDVASLTDNIQVRFHCYGATTFDINWYYIDNFAVTSDTGSSTGRDMTGSTVSTNDTYIPGNTHTMEFSVNILSPDVSYSDSVAITFPTGVTILDAGPDELGFGAGAYGPEPFNGIDGQTISWGTNANDAAGGIYGSLTVWATLSFADSLSGPLVTSYHVSDDWWNTPVDVDGNFSINQRDLTDGDLLGYNVYVDENTNPVNLSFIEQTSYIVTGLTNEQSYTFGVTAVYYPAYESNPMEVTVTPTWLYGDVSGTVTDPNGSLLDSAIVRVGNNIDTTGADGTYFLDNLEPGVHTVSVQRQDFENDSEEVTVIAQAAAVVQDFVLTPSLARAGGLEATAGDHQIDLIWSKPGASGSYELYYYDDIFEAQIGCGGGCEFGVRYTPLGYPATLTTLLVSVQGDAGVISGNIIAFIDESGSGLGPDGLTSVTLASGLDLSSPDGSLTQYEVDVSEAGLVANSGDVYVMIQENNAGFMGIANDIEPQSPEYYDRNWVMTGGLYQTIFDAVGGDPSLTGDFGVLATFDGASLAAATLNSSNQVVEQVPTAIHDGTFKTGVDAAYDIESNRYQRTPNPDNVVRLMNIHIPEPAARSRTDSLIGYNIYQALDDGDTLVTTNTGADDTTATITVPDNYVEYCYNVRARWSTDNYGVLESKPTGDVCAVPYRAGDIDFNDAVDVSDLLSVVDYVLEVSIPTEDQFRGADVNQDTAITINDVVLIVDIIYGTAARTMASADATALADLLSADQQLLISLDYDGLTRGIQFELDADAALEFGTPLLAVNDAGTMVSSHRTEAGKITVVVVNTTGGTVERYEDILVRLPYTFKGNRRDKAVVELTDLQAAGMAGESLPVTIGEKRIDISVIPSVFALHQNYPNPFNPVTEIQFDVPVESQVTLTIYNIMGQEVTTLTNSTLKAGFHNVRWDGTNGYGELVSTGVYFYRLSSPAFTSTKKMIMVK